MPSRPTHPPLNPRTAMVYFSLNTNIEGAFADAREGDKAAQALLDEPEKLPRLEDKALKELSRKFGQRIDNEGHDGNGDLVCKFGVNDWAEVKAAKDVIDANLAGYGTDDTMELDAPYMVARDFRLYPDGVNDNFYGEERGSVGTWETWLKFNDPQFLRYRGTPIASRSRAGSKRKNPSSSGMKKSMGGYSVGDRVLVRAHDGNVFEDTIRALFVQDILLQPYAPNKKVPAAVLTERSWTPLSDIVRKVNPSRRR